MRFGFVLLALLASCVHAPEYEIPDYVKKTKNPPFKPPEPSKKNWDWVQLTSDEWLKGEIKYLRNFQLEIDSDELDDLKFEWRKVKALKSPRLMDLLLENQSMLSGPVMVKDNQVVVKQGTEFAVFPREHLLTIVPGGKSGWSYWSGKFSLGATIRTGNTNQTDANISFKTRRRAPRSRFEFDYMGNFSQVGGVDTVDNHRLTSRYDIYIAKRWFATPAAIELYRDPFQNIRTRVTPLVGGGYYIFKKGIDKKPIDWDVGILGGYRWTRFDSGEEPSGTATIGFSTNIDWDITPKLEIDLSYDIQVGLPDTSDTNQNLTLKFSWDIWKDIDLDITFVWNFVGAPQADAQGNVPEKADTTLTFGFGWEF